jgi:ADP-ribosylglycohydrolase
MKIDRAQGCLLGQLAGDSLGSLVEFKTPQQILKLYPNGVRHLADGGTWNTIAGQPTDDSEMALMLARMLAKKEVFDAQKAKEAYVYWLDSNPFDCGTTTTRGLTGRPDMESQANGALMRISPLGIFGANHDLEQVALWARQDAAITHSHPICQQASALFAMAIAYAVDKGGSAEELYGHILKWAKDLAVEKPLFNVIVKSAKEPPEDFVSLQGWVLIAFGNALWQLVHAADTQTAVIDTVMRGGDTDTNAAICGALLGAVYGEGSIPDQWKNAILNCCPSADNPKVCHPRPECFWPADALDLAEKLLLAGSNKKYAE